jgi:LysM repeat protein
VARQPDEPEFPDAPEIPSEPATADEPEFPDAPEIPSEPATADEPEVADTPEVADEPDFPDAPEVPHDHDHDHDHDHEPEPEPPGRRAASDTALPWFLAAVVVLLLAVSAGLIAAWVVASLKAVPIPAGAIVTASPVPAPTDAPSGQATPLPSEQPRHTPTPAPQVTPEPAPFVHVVQRGEYLTLIADMYEVRIEDILALNDIPNPNRIRAGRELLIPGYGIRPSPSPGA